MTERRYTQAIGMTEKSDPKRYDLGRRQAQCAIERYHYLCAAAQEAYTLHNPGAFRSELTFEKYTAYPLTPVSAKLHPRKDGTIHPGDIEIYVKCMVRNFKCSEGGIMYCLGDERSFWNMVINYHSSAKTSGIKAWDRLFKQLKASGYDKGIIPCMVAMRVFECCLSANCSFAAVLCNPFRMQRPLLSFSARQREERPGEGKDSRSAPYNSRQAHTARYRCS